MVDVLSAQDRSKLMARIGSFNTKPELAVRHILHSAGFRYRLHENGIPGRPDIVLRSSRALILVNGCFWHGHSCYASRMPKSNRSFWRAKIKSNISRDASNLIQCRALGWRILIVWECALAGKGRLTEERLGREIITWLEREVKRPSVKQIKGRKVV